MEPVSRVSYRPLGGPFSEHCIQLAELGNVLLVRADCHESLADFKAVSEHLKSIAKRTNGQCALLFLVDHSSGPNPGFAENAKRVLDENEAWLMGVSTVLLTEGFVAALYRSVGAVIIRLVGKRGLVNVSGTVHEGASWAVEKLPQSVYRPDAEALISAANILLATQRTRRRL